MCTLIDESEVLEAQAAEAIWEDLTKALPMLNIGLVHGRMKPQEKQDVMMRFKMQNWIYWWRRQSSKWVLMFRMLV